MNISMQKKIRIGLVLALALVMSSAAALSVRTNALDVAVESAAGIPLAGFATEFNIENLDELDVTAGISDTLMDTTVVAVADMGLVTVGASYSDEEDSMERMIAEQEDSAELVIAGYEHLGIAIVDGNLNVRKAATTNSAVVGKMTNHAACEIIDEDGEWYQIKSGKVEGYVKAEYVVTGEEAYAIAAEEIMMVATVKTTTLRVRKEPNTESGVLALVGDGEDLIVKNEVDGWYEVEVDNLSGFVSGDYVEISLKLPTAQTLTELTFGKGVSDVRVSLVQYALQFVGNRYVWGGTSLTNGIDCSGFTMQVYAKYGVKLPHYSGSQPSYGTRIKSSDARPGDLFFYGSGGKIGHVAIYIGNGQIVHASNARTGIKVSNAFYRTPICVVSYLP